MHSSNFIEKSLEDIQSSPVECLGKILERICKAVDCYGVILTFDDENDALALDVLHGYQPEDAREHRSERLKLYLEPQKSVSSEAFIEARNTGVAQPKLISGHDPLTHRITEEEIEEILAYPISGLGEWVGVLTLESLRDGVLKRFIESTTGKHLLEVFGSVLSMAFAARQSLVFRFDEFLKQNKFRDFETLSHQTLDWVFNKFKVNSCAIYFIDYDKDKGEDYVKCMNAIVDKSSEQDIGNIRYGIGEGYAGWVADLQHSLILTEFENDRSKELDRYQRDFEKRPQRAKKLGLRHPSLKFKSYIGVPISHGEETVGVLEILDTEREYAFSDEGLLEMIARRIGSEYKRLSNNLKREKIFEIPKLDTRHQETVIDGVVETAIKVTAATHGFFMYEESDGSLKPQSVKGHNLDASDIPPTSPGEENLVRWVMEEHKEFSFQNLRPRGRSATVERAQPPRSIEFTCWDNSFKPKGFIPEYMQSLLMVPVFLGSPHEIDADPTEDLGVLVLMSTRANAFQQDEVVVTALAQIVSYHIWANKKSAELESQRNEISELRQLMPQYEHAMIAAAVTAGTMHTVRNHVNNINESLVKLLALDKIKGDPEIRKLADTVKEPFVELTALYGRLFENVFGGFKPVFEVCDMAALVQEAREYMEPTFRKRGVNFKSFLKGARLPKVRADSILMKVVFINLVKNSIDANARNIIVRGKEITGYMDQPVLELTFEDDGIGIPKTKVDVAGNPVLDDSKKPILNWEFIFKPFETAHKKGGTGLGLAVNTEIIDKHEGEIRVVSSLVDGSKHGTVIAVTLPL